MKTYDKILELQRYGFHEKAVGIYLDMHEYVYRAYSMKHWVLPTIRVQMNDLEKILLSEHQRLIKQ